MHGFAVIHPGLEPVVAAELAGLGLEGEIVPGGVRFAADAARVATLTRTMRTPSQMLLELATGPARSPDALGGLIKRIPWKQVLNPAAEVRVEVSTKGSRLHFKDTVTRAATAMIRDARKTAYVADKGARPRVAQLVQVRVVDDVATISVDAGGDLLHRRGWRQDTVRAPIRENLGACLLALAEWDGGDALYDPFCGSGTLPIEAALLAAERPPFGRRSFACDEWVGASGPKRSKPGAPGATPVRAPSHPPAVPIVGSDHHAPTVLGAIQNAKRAGVSPSFRHLDVLQIEPPAVVGTVVTNPPYGERLGEHVDGTYTAFGRVLRERFQSWRVVFLSPDRRLAMRVDERVERLTTFKNGGLGVGVWTFLA